MIKKVITITLFLFCLKLIPLFSCDGLYSSGAALHPVVMSPDIMLIEEVAEIGYDVERNRYIVNLELVYENSGERQRAKGRFRTGESFNQYQVVNGKRNSEIIWISDVEVKVNSKNIILDELLEITAGKHVHYAHFFTFDSDFIKGRNRVKLSYELIGFLNKISIDVFYGQKIGSFYVEDIYKKTLNDFTLHLYPVKDSMIVKGLPYKSQLGALSFDTYSSGAHSNVNAISPYSPTFAVIKEGDKMILKKHSFRQSKKEVIFSVSVFKESFFEYLPSRSYRYFVSPLLFKEKDIELIDDIIALSKKVDIKALDNRSDETIELSYYYYLAGLGYPFPNRDKVRIANKKLPYYFPDDKFSFNNLSEEAQQRFLMLNSYRNNRLQPEIYQPFVKNLRVRSEPGLKGKVVGKLALFKQVRLLERGELTEIDGLSGNWVLIEDSRGLKGWCFDGYMEGM